MSVLSYSDHVEIFKFKSTGMIHLFDEVKAFIESERMRGKRWEPVDLYSNEDGFYVRLEPR